jgi:predicted outer membrane repeat protein
MKRIFEIILACLGATGAASAATHYVNVNSASPSSPYNSWVTAATTIQDAVDASSAGDDILVTNGVYSSGGRSVFGNISNRVAVDRAVNVHSVNGPQVTIIQGAGANGNTRCVYLTFSASLSGFTLTNGATPAAGDLYRERSGGGLWCESSSSCFVSNCVILGNSAAYFGGGAYRGDLYNCLIVGNVATNTSGAGGGACSNRLSNCTIASNAAINGAGVSGAILRNCILYFNNGPSNTNYFNSFLNYCCTQPLPSGTGNFISDPQFVDRFGGNYHLQSTSSCINTGNNADAPVGMDLDGNPRIFNGTVDLGVYEFETPTAPTINGQPTDQSVTVGSNATFSVSATGSVPLYYQWTFNLNAIPDATYASLTLTNVQPSQAGNYAAIVSNSVSSVTSQSAVLTVRIPATRYVDAGSASPAPPYTSWATAAQTIQDAVDVAVGGDEIVVTNGTYSTGGHAIFGSMTNRVAVTNSLTIHSVNGPQFTTIQGYQVPGLTNANGAIRCIYLSGNATLSGFTLSNGATHFGGDLNQERSGGGVWVGGGALVSNCVISGCSAAANGGGAFQGTLINCTLTGNFTGNLGTNGGGGAYKSTLINCIISGNQAPNGGGAFEGMLTNCSVTSNSATNGGGAYQATLASCTLSGNFARNGGAACLGSLFSCILNGNSAVTNGGGTFNATNGSCAFSGNTATNGGAIYGGQVNVCWITNNSAVNGGGASASSLNNCVVAGNTAGTGGGIYQGGGTNCTVIGNSGSVGSGAYLAILENSIIIFNHGGSDLAGGIANYSCVSQAGAGTSNVVADPKFVDAAAGNFRLQPSSPCINAGYNSWQTSLTDLDGNPRIAAATLDIGAYEYQGPVPPSIITQPGDLTVNENSDATFTVSAAGSTPLSYQWSGNGADVIYGTNATLTLTNVQLSQSGLYKVVITNSAGTVTSREAQLTVTAGPTSGPHYVDANNGSPLWPYTSWATAARSIQPAIDAAVPGDEIIVTNGLYATGGAYYSYATNRVLVNKPVNVHSANGPQFTVIQGFLTVMATNGEGTRCICLTNGSSFSGFTLTNGSAVAGGGALCASSATVSNCVVVGNYCPPIGNGGGVSGGLIYDCLISNNLGGGVYSAVLNNCVISKNSGGTYGGGAYLSTLTNCTLSSNSTSYGGGVADSTAVNCLLAGNSGGYEGGGAWGGTLYNCTIVSNSAALASGGAATNHLRANGNCVLYNCIAYFNTAPSAPNAENASQYYCCTPTPGVNAQNIITAPPQFVHPASGNYRLLATSPCIDAGNSTYTPSATDLDGNPRVARAAIDMGAYEFQGGPSLAIRPGPPPDKVTLAWPTWASNFTLQAQSGPQFTNSWTNVVGTPILINNQNTLSLPADETLKLFRLQSQ